MLDLHPEGPLHADQSSEQAVSVPTFYLLIGEKMAISFPVLSPAKINRLI